MPSSGRWLLPAALLAGVSAAQAQAPESPPEIPVEAELVRVDVVVTDGTRPIAGLSREDFAVFEDGQPQEISQFEAFAGRGREAREPAPEPAEKAIADGATAPPTRPGRHVVLAIDDLHISIGNLTRVKQALLDFVDRELEPGDDAAVVVTSGALGVTQQFTRDVGLIRQAISRISPKPPQSWPGVPFMTRYQAELIEGGDPEALDLAVEEIRLEGLMVTRPDEVARQKARSIFKEAEHYARAALGTLDNVVRSLTGLPGRKLVVLVSDGFLLGLGASSERADDVRRVVDAATRAGVVAYALDARGLLATTETERPESYAPLVTTRPGVRERFGRAAEQAERDGLHAVASGTGGFLVHGVNDLGAGLERIARDVETYYLLAYAPTNTRHDGKFREIEVRLPGRPDLEIRTRTGYFAPKDGEGSGGQGEGETPGARAARELLGALASLYPHSAVPLRLAADFVSQGSAGQQLVLCAHVDLAATRFRREGDSHHARLVFVGTVYDAAGAPAASLEPQAAGLGLSDAELQRAQREGLKYEKVLALPPGAYEVRLAVRDEASGHLGSASARITLPDLSDGELRMAGPVLMRMLEPDPGVDDEATLRQVQARPRYGRGESLYFQLQVLNATTDGSGANRVAVQALVLQGADLKWSTQALLETRPQDSLPPDFTGRVSLARLEPGDYQLRIVVTDQLAGTSVARLMPFSVVE